MLLQGSKEGLAWWARLEGKDPDFLAAKSFDYGFTKIWAHNSSHLQLEQISIDQVNFLAVSKGLENNFSVQT